MNNIKNGQVILIRHIKTKRYLHASIMPIKGQDKKIDRFHIYASSNLLEPFCFWIIKTQEQMMSNIRLGDFVQLKSVITQLYLSSDDSCKSKITKQGLVYQSVDAQYWLLIPQQPQQYPVQSEFIDGCIKLINMDGRHLHSHNCFYKKGELNNKAEVSGFLEKDDNDYWELIPQEPEYLIYRAPEIQNNLIKIKQLKKVIIRNYSTGHSLHSHQQTYSNGNQEVTGFKERDVNDLWNISFKQGDQESQFLIQLQHFKTGNYLYCQKNTKNYSKQGLQVYCTKTKPNEYIWELQMVKQQFLYLNEAFIIIFKPNGNFLTELDSSSESAKNQKQIAVTQNSSINCFWMIEYQEN